jgi:hypothetical protein
MNYLPTAQVQKMIGKHMKKGGYATLDDLFAAALAALDDAVPLDEFAHGELDALLAEGDADIERGDVIDGEQALEDRRRRRETDLFQ